jgi:hypothetical protein
MTSAPRTFPGNDEGSRKERFGHSRAGWWLLLEGKLTLGLPSTVTAESYLVTWKLTPSFQLSSKQLHNLLSSLFASPFTATVFISILYEYMSERELSITPSSPPNPTHRS